MKQFNSYIMMLVMAVIAIPSLTSCEDDDDYIAQQLRDRDWQGTVEAYYRDRWGLTGSTYATVMRFESKGNYYTSGRGYEVDYDIRSPYRDYAYCTFSWCIVNRDIYLIYDDDAWSVMYIQNYGLNDRNFWGYIDSKSSGDIRFDFENVAYDGWGNYRQGGYGGFEHQNWYRYRSRTAPSFNEEGETPEARLFFDRTEYARQQSGEADAVSVVSGVFAEKIKKE